MFSIIQPNLWSVQLDFLANKVELKKKLLNLEKIKEALFQLHISIGNTKKLMI